jgi:hypothetical protein
MKPTKKIGLKQLRFAAQLVSITTGVLVLLCMPYMTSRADAQGHIYHVNSYHGMAALAEKELREKEQQVVPAHKIHEERNAVSATPIAFGTVKNDDGERRFERTKSSEK